MSIESRTNRVLFISPQPFFIPRGSPFRVHATVRALVRLGFEVDLLVFPFGEKVDITGVIIIRTWSLPFIASVPTGPSWSKFLLDILLFFAALRLVLTRKYRLIHGIEEGGIIAAVLGAIFRKPFIFDMHSHMSEQLRNLSSYYRVILSRVMSVIERRCIKRAFAVITVGEQHTAFVRSISPNANCVSLHDIPLSCANEDSAKLRDKLRKQFSLQDCRLVLYTGNLDPCQGLPLLIRGFFHYIKKYSSGQKVKLLIAGGGEAETHRLEELKVLAQDLGLRHEVIFAGQLLAEVMEPLMQLSEVLVSPRISGANTPLKIYNYMAAQRIIVATRICSHTQVLDDSCAVLHEPDPDSMAEALAFALNESPAYVQRRQELIEKACLRVNDLYSFDKFVRDVACAYAGAVSQGFGLENSISLNSEKQSLAVSNS